MRVDALDLVERLARQRGEAQPDGDDDLADDQEVVLEEQVEVLADGPVEGVLDRQEPSRRGVRGDHPKDVAKAADRQPRNVAERGDHRVFGKGAGLAGIGHGKAPDVAHGRRPVDGYWSNQFVVAGLARSLSYSARRPVGFRTCFVAAAVSAAPAQCDSSSRSLSASM